VEEGEEKEEGGEEEEEVHTVSRDFEDLARHQGYGLPKDAEAQAAITWGGLCPAGGYVAMRGLPCGDGPSCARRPFPRRVSLSSFSPSRSRSRPRIERHVCMGAPA